jgi:UDPglucose 6-dehydrogenase
MRIAVFGCGYVGLTTAVGFAELGNDVIGVDTDPKKLLYLRLGRVPFYEPGLSELLARNLKEKRLRFVSDAKTAIENSDVIINAVGTPPKKDSSADLSAVLKVASVFGKYGSSGKIFVNKSTVPVGTSDLIIRKIEKARGKDFSFHLFSNPEFLREGSALQDFFSPDRIVIGLRSDNGTTEKARLRKIVDQLFRPMLAAGVPIIFTDLRSAECIKYASNSYLATRISFINEMANFCEKAGANVKEVAKGIGMDKRIGTHFLDAGIGFGGSCLPKDLTALISIGKQQGFNFRILKAVHETNQNQGLRIVEKLKTALPNLKGKKVAIWGLSFKPKTDDMRDAPSINIIKELLQHGVKLQVYDPAATQNVNVIFGNKLKYCENNYSALADCEALLILTEWDEFKNPDYPKMKGLMRKHYIIDGRNMLEPEEALAHGFSYLSIGRQAILAKH